MPLFTINDQCSNDACPRGARPAWAGPVTITWEEIMHVTSGPIARITSVMGVVVPGSTTGRKAAPEPSNGFRVSQSRPPKGAVAVNHYNTGRPDLDKGHLMALELGGPDIPENIVPQWSNWQRNGRWRQMETSVLAEAKAVMGQGTHLLVFGVMAIYHQYRNNALGNYDRLRVPKKFVVATATVPRGAVSDGLTGLRWTKVFDEEQRQDATDFMMAERHFKPKARVQKFKSTTAKITTMEPLRTREGSRRGAHALHAMRFRAEVAATLPGRALASPGDSSGVSPGDDQD